MKHVSHSAILRKYAGRISITFFILVIENLLLLLEPFVLGVAINGLTVRDWQGVFIFLGLEVAITAIGVARRYYDTRAYGSIYREIGNDISAAAIQEQDDLSPAIGRADLLQEVIDFFENEMPMGFASIFAILGALAMLFFLAPEVGMAGLGASVGIGAIFILSRHRIKAFNRMMNDELEARARIFMNRKRAPLAVHFANFVTHKIALSDLEARNFGLSYLFVIFLIAFALYDSVAVRSASMGDVFAILTYTSQFAQGVLVLPMMYQQYIRTAEITGRISTEASTEAREPVE